MVDEIDLEKVRALLEATGDPIVRSAGCGITARVVVDDGHGKCAVDNGVAENFPRMRDAFIHRAEADFLHADEAELCIQEEDPQRFLSHGHELSTEEIENPLRCVEDRREALTAGEALADFESGRHFEGFGWPDALGVTADFLRRAARELREAAAVAQEVAGDGERVFSGKAGADEDGQQLGI